ncbi:MAG: 2Fe-2S iron-sulfur cluster-binding protein [Archangium sp.]
MEVRRGTSLLRAAVKAGLPIGQSCRGIGICAACKVRVLEGVVAPPDALERTLAARIPLEKGERYSCRARVVESCVITTSYW